MQNGLPWAEKRYFKFSLRVYSPRLAAQDFAVFGFDTPLLAAG